MSHKLLVLALLALQLITSNFSNAQTSTVNNQANNALWQRMGHEPTHFGYAYDSNDENYIDINLSLKWSPHSNGAHPNLPINNKPEYRCSWRWFTSGCLFLAFTTEQAFYFGTRDSSPVIGQRFNPEIFLRFWQSGSGYLDIGFNHESNGQSIDSQEEFEAKQRELSNGEHEGPSAAKEFLSRNWNYWELTYKSRENIQLMGNAAYSYYLVGRYFIDTGSETSFDFEGNTNNTERSEVDGLQFIGKRDGQCAAQRHCLARKLVYSYTTGYENPFKYDAHRLEWGFTVDKWPITLWMHLGYNEDLIDFYRHVKSAGLSFEITGI